MFAVVVPTPFEEEGEEVAEKNPAAAIGSWGALWWSVAGLIFLDM